MARAKNIHPNYKETKFIFLNSPMAPMTIRSAINVPEKSLSKSIETHEAWNKEKKIIQQVNNIKDRFNVSLI